MIARASSRVIAAVLAGAAFASPAADIVLTPPAGGGVSITNAAGTVTRFRVADDGSITMPGLGAVPVPSTGLCVEIATGKVGTCSQAVAGVTAVTAALPLASSGGAAPNITLASNVPVNRGGTGASSLANNGVLVGNGSNPILGTIAGSTGQVLTGNTGFPPSWSGSPTLSGNLNLDNSTSATVGNIVKLGSPFLHNHGTANTFVGMNAGNFTTTGAGGNFGGGQGALVANTTGTGNTAAGFLALTANTTGNDNTALGYQVLMANTTGASNTAIGRSALSQLTTGIYNIAIGDGAGSGQTTGWYNVYIFNGGVPGENGTIRIGQGNHTRVFIAGIRGRTTEHPDAVPVLIDSYQQLGTVNSSRRFKDRIADMGEASAGLMSLRPVTFQYKQHGPDSRLQYGLIAEEVAAVYPGLVARSADGEVETVMYQFLPPMLLNEYQKQARRIAELEEKVERLTRALGDGSR